jgi:murein DD-endopeptidase MepM/ murein hydrolase activator NlpD
MHRIALLIMLFLLVVTVSAQEATTTPTPRIRPVAAATLNQSGLVLERYFPQLQQGQVGLLRLSGDGIQEARVLLRNREYPFYLDSDESWYALVVADIDAQPRDYPLTVIVRTLSGESLNFEQLFAITSGGFVRQSFEVPPNLGYLIDPEVERNEFARIEAVIAASDSSRLWGNQAWQLAMNAPYSSAFGQYRILSQTIQTRHTGWDQSAPIGTPVAASASGVVAFAGRLDIRGNYILIDHGWGVFTGYAHLSQMNVERGQTIEQGQIIGASGNSGRSSGPHLHWEVLVSGEWVDGALFLEMWLPG